MTLADALIAAMLLVLLAVAGAVVWWADRPPRGK
jgi:uncharacterized iron-regulated membrane protein